MYNSEGESLKEASFQFTQVHTCMGILHLHPDTPGSEWTTVNGQITTELMHSTGGQGAMGGHGRRMQREACTCHFNSEGVCTFIV